MTTDVHEFHVFIFTVSIGGTAGLFLGCSILSLFEAVYFFLLRPFYSCKYKLPLAFA